MEKNSIFCQITITCTTYTHTYKTYLHNELMILLFYVASHIKVVVLYYNTHEDMHIKSMLIIFKKLQPSFCLHDKQTHLLLLNISI